MSADPYAVLLSLVPGIGPASFRRLLQRFPDARSAWLASPLDLAAAGLDRKTVDSLLTQRRTRDPDREWERLQRLGVQVLALDDLDYPAALREISDPPPLLYVKGTLEPVDAWSVAVVGTRRASAYGRQVVERIIPDLARSGVTIVSGLAKGVDSFAHRATLAAGGRTIAVLANGLDIVYPAENAGLSREISGQGALASEYALGTRPDAINFPRRNRVISGLCLGTLVVEAGSSSGALITADFALEQGRDVFAVPGSTCGCNHRSPAQFLREAA